MSNNPKIIVTVGGVTHEVARGTSVRELLPGDNGCSKSDQPAIVAVRVNNNVRDVNYRLHSSTDLEWVRADSEEGMRIYRSSLVFLMLRAAYEVLPGCQVYVKHSLSNGLYGEIAHAHPVLEKDIEAIEKIMRALVRADEPITMTKVPTEQARTWFGEMGFSSKVNLLESTTRRQVTVHQLGWYRDYLASPIVPNTGLLAHFRLRFYLPGFILEYPRRSNPCEVPEYVEQGKLANVYFEAERWQKTIAVETTADLNRMAASDKSGDLIRLCEAYHEKQIAAVADEIAKSRDRLRVILIAGPSSSGKTTFAQRLSVQLRVNGLKPTAIGLDDYFVDRELTPKDADGHFDFEALDAIDIHLFNEHLSRLIQGEEVSLPTYNFVKGQREWNGRTLRVTPEQPLIIEGIHGLNDALTSSIPKGRKFKIYVSALTNLNVDDHTRIPTTDVRLLRRLIRDVQFRGHSARDTIALWPSVRRGEERHIFPFQEDADTMFNSTLVYELAILKTHAEPLLAAIPADVPEYSEARRLLRFLSHFRPMSAVDQIPNNSILKEFIGGSGF